MSELLIGMASGLAINVITWLSGRLGISKTYVSVGMCLLIGVLIYFGQILVNRFPMAYEQIVAFATGSYGFSQMVRNVWNKIKEDK